MQLLALAGLGLTAAALGAALLHSYDVHRTAHLEMPEPLRPFRPLPIRLINALDAAVTSFTGTSLIPLDADALVASACARFAAKHGGAACDFGDAASEYGDFMEGLTVFVDSLNTAGKLTLIGRVLASCRISMLLEQRLALVRYWKSSEHGAGVASAELAPPVFIVGLTRTGTTFLHMLLSQDTDNFVSPLNWMVVDPVPPLVGWINQTSIEAATEGDAPGVAAMRAARIAEAARNLDYFKWLAPGLDAQHTVTAFLPEECIVFMSHTFVTWELISYFNVPRYGEWLRDQPGFADVFAWHRQMLRHFQSAAPPPRRAWVLKTPYHTGMLADLAQEYPEARVIMTHRRPVTALSSLSTLQMKLRSVTTDALTPLAMAEENFALWDRLAERAVDVRKGWAAAAAATGGNRTGAAGPAKLVDVELSGLHRDPMASVRAIYEQLGLELSPGAEKAMRGWLAENGREKHGKNAYSTEWFGFKNASEALDRYGGLRRYDDYYCHTLFEGSEACRE